MIEVSGVQVGAGPLTTAMIARRMQSSNQAVLMAVAPDSSFTKANKVLHQVNSRTRGWSTNVRSAGVLSTRAWAALRSDNFGQLIRPRKVGELAVIEQRNLELRTL